MRIIVACASVELNGLKREPAKDGQIQPAAWFCMASIYIYFFNGDIWVVEDNGGLINRMELPW